MELLLEPCQGSFTATYQKAAYDSNLPIMVFSVGKVEVGMTIFSSLAEPYPSALITLSQAARVKNRFTQKLMENSNDYR